MQKQKLEFKPRPYQEKAHVLLVESFRRKATPLVLMPTGTGKTKTMISFMDKYKGFFDFIVIVRQIGLVEQFANDVADFGLEHSIFMGSNKNNPDAQVQVCSIDTIKTRKTYPKINSKRDLVIFIDEADESVADGYQEAISAYKTRAENKPQGEVGRTFICGFTATAFDKALEAFSEVIEPITPEQAREAGYLVPFIYKVPQVIDLEKIEITKGEFNTKQLDVKFNSPEMIKLSLESWLTFGDNRQTLIFTNSQAHAEAVSQYFNSYFTKEICQVVTSKVSPKERQEIYTKFRNGLIRFIVNIKVITRGVDIPEIGCIIDLAPTVVENLHIQKIGRGARINPIYKDCILIDLANNCIRNGPFYDFPRIPRIVPFKKKYNKSNIAMVICVACRSALLRSNKVFTCPYCGERLKLDAVKNEKSVKKVKIDLTGMSEEKIKQIKMINDFKRQLFVNAELTKKYQNNIVEARKATHIYLIEKYGIEAVRKIAKSIGFRE